MRLVLLILVFVQFLSAQANKPSVHSGINFRIPDNTPSEMLKLAQAVGMELKTWEAGQRLKGTFLVLMEPSPYVPGRIQVKVNRFFQTEAYRATMMQPIFFINPKDEVQKIVQRITKRILALESIDIKPSLIQTQRKTARNNSPPSPHPRGVGGLFFLPKFQYTLLNV